MLMRVRRAPTRALVVAGFVAVLVLVSAPPVFAQTGASSSTAGSFVLPAWAFPTPALERATVESAHAHSPVGARRLPGSRASFTAVQASDLFFALDWFPRSHPPLPEVVAHGRQPMVFACGTCHLPDGAGRPENATLAGLPSDYITAQVEAMSSGARHSALQSYGPGVRMQQVAAYLSASELKQAAAYFSALHARQRSRVVEAVRIPRPVAGEGIYFRDQTGGTEPLGDRLIEMAVDREAHEVRAPYVSYIAYVPPGSVQRGLVLATTGRGATAACTSCHGPQLRGVGVIPPIAWRHASYILRQLLAFRTGTRASPAGAPMRTEAATLDLDDMIAVAAYAASLRH